MRDVEGSFFRSLDTLEPDNCGQVDWGGGDCRKIIEAWAGEAEGWKLDAG